MGELLEFPNTGFSTANFVFKAYCEERGSLDAKKQKVDFRENMEIMLLNAILRELAS